MSGHILLSADQTVGGVDVRVVGGVAGGVVGGVLLIVIIIPVVVVMLIIKVHKV